MRITRRQIVEGEMVPNWDGVSYMDLYSGSLICHPVPFNLVVRAWKWVVLAYYRVVVHAGWLPDPHASLRLLWMTEGENRANERFVKEVAREYLKATRPKEEH